MILLACLALRLTVRFSPDLRARTLAVLAPVAKSCHSGHTPQISYPAYPAYSGLSGQKKPPTCANMLVVRKIPGIVLLSHSQIYSTIAAGALNYRVREGNVCFCSAMDAGK